MKFFKCFLVLVGIQFCLSSCMTPITDPNVLNDLTTCRNTSLEKIKKNLLLMGYEIAKSDDQSISTEYKQDSGYSGSRLFSRVNVVKVSPKVIKFKVIEKHIYKSTDADRSYINTHGTNRNNYGGVSRQTGGAEIVSYKTVTNENESDRTYYIEKEHEYRMFKDQLCGFGR